ncbi:MAG: sigma-70 family RNA polymerase sigma factor [Bacteroidales bacterium]|jgi:RNA polymerase sigma-70 factor (ECF subfamily)|nr:sigma-70 family RNA polymerase sigma factor [Bacteroidales bacterium]
MAQEFLTSAFIRLRQKLKNVSGRILSDSDAAEDILQDSFVQLWKRQYPLKSEKEAEALLARTVRNASLNERRKIRPEPISRDYEEDSPRDHVEKERAYNQLRQKIYSELTPLQRYIMEEKEFGGRTLEDIARELGMDAAAVRMQLSRARKQIRDSFKDGRQD